MSTGGGQPEPPPEPPRPSPFGAFRLTGILAAGLLALVIGISTFAQVGSDDGGDAGSSSGLSREAAADGICAQARDDLPRRPRSGREAVDAAHEKASILLEVSSRLGGAGDDLGAAIRRWANAEARLPQALRAGGTDLARARRSVRAARRMVVAAARRYPAKECVRLARRG